MTDLKTKIKAQYQEALKDLNTLSDKELREKYTVMPSGWVLLDATHAAEPAPVTVEGAPERVWFKTNGIDQFHTSVAKPAKWWEWNEYIRAELAPTGNTALVALFDRMERDWDNDGQTEYADAAHQIAAAMRRRLSQPAAPQPTPEVEALVEWWKSQLPKVADFPAPLFAEKIEQTIAALARGSVADKGER